VVGGDLSSTGLGTEGGGGTGGATAEEASALSIEILLSEVKPKLSPKEPFLVTTPGGTCDRFLQIRETFVGFLPAESIFEKKKASSKPHGKKVFSWSF
jgi:hypothetical protein